MKWLFIVQTLFTGAYAGAGGYTDWKQFLRVQICWNQESYHQTPEQMNAEIQATTASILRFERASSLSQAGKKPSRRYNSAGSALDIYFLAVASGNQRAEVDLKMFLTDKCKNLVPSSISAENCGLLNEIIYHPEEARKEVNAQVAFLRRTSKPTGREISRNIDGTSANVEDARESGGGFGLREKERYFVRGGKRYMRVGYGFWEFISTGKFCIYPSGCEYEIETVSDGLRRITQAEYSYVPIEDCIAQGATSEIPAALKPGELPRPGATAVD